MRLSPGDPLGGLTCTLAPNGYRTVNAYPFDSYIGTIHVLLRAYNTKGRLETLEGVVRDIIFHLYSPFVTT
jgi:hypothetical protein